MIGAAIAIALVVGLMFFMNTDVGPWTDQERTDMVQFFLIVCLSVGAVLRDWRDRRE